MILAGKYINNQISDVNVVDKLDNIESDLADFEN